MDENASPVIKSTFSVDPHTGVISLISLLDREVTPDYSFTVIAEDGGAQPLTAKALVTVQVKDYNDNPPVFTKEMYISAGKQNLFFTELQIY